MILTGILFCDIIGNIINKSKSVIGKGDKHYIVVISKKQSTYRIPEINPNIILFEIDIIIFIPQNFFSEWFMKIKIASIIAFAIFVT